MTAPEIRLDHEGLVDEVVGRFDVHLERMDDDRFSLLLYPPDGGERLHLGFVAERGRLDAFAFERRGVTIDAPAGEGCAVLIEGASWCGCAECRYLWGRPVAAWVLAAIFGDLPGRRRARSMLRESLARRGVTLRESLARRGVTL